MVSRDTAVHVTVVTLALFALFVLRVLFPALDTTTLVVVALLFNGLVFAGAHLVLAVLGEDGLVPVRSRWRFVGLVALVLVLSGVVLLTDRAHVAGVRVDAVAAVLGVGASLVYLALEAREGYGESDA